MMRHRQLPIEMECQTADFWCWAAVTQCINSYLKPVPSLSQAEIASDHVGTQCSPEDDPFDVPTCGQSPCGGPCNSPHRLSEVLRSQGHTVSAIPTDRNPLTFSEVVQQIDGGRPLPLRIEIPKRTNGGHFVCIIGYADDGAGNEFVAILDPLVPGKNLGRADVRDIPFEMLIAGNYPLRSEIGIPNYKYYI